MIVALALLLLGPAEDFPDPISPAASGQQQCYQPDRARKTCQSLAGYRSDGKGGFLNDAEVLLSSRTGLVMRSTTPVTIRDGAVCGRITREAHDAAVFTQNGQPLSPDAADRIRIALAGTGLFGREICTRYPARGDHLVAVGTLDGKPGVLPESDVIWVRPDEGYRVAS
jgi:hypothetical protein